jgi:hypothetical protein
MKKSTEWVRTMKKSTEWVRCPICNEPDMEMETVVDDGDEAFHLINCVNHACKSNIPLGAGKPREPRIGSVVRWTNDTSKQNFEGIVISMDDNGNCYIGVFGYESTVGLNKADLTVVSPENAVRMLEHGYYQ